MVEVQVTGGVVEGAERDGVASFLGVPYAAPPFGEHRLRPPQPVVAWEGVRDATQYGATVPKGDYPPQYQPLLPEPTVPGEDCLNLNVWTPADAVGSGRLPVLVWVHGGSFMNGSGAVPTYDGTAFARDGVVCVTINYRLAADGFLYTAADRGTGTANVGLQDQVAALRWVRDNIAAFGGDPARVTVAGESAGAMSVTTLLAMPSARGLFAQAVTQSGAAAHTLTPETGETVARTLAEALGVEPTREAIAAVDLDVLVKTASDLVVEVQTAPDPQKWGSLALSLLPFAPVVDGEVLPEEPLAAFAGGASSEVRVLVGSNRDESRLFLVAPGAIDHVDEPTLTAGSAAYGLSPEGLEVYRAHRPEASPGDVMAAVVTDWFFAVPGLRHAEAREAGGGTTWVYRFDHPTDPADNHGFGAAHAVEIPYVFDTAHLPIHEPLLGPERSQAVADTAHAVWVAFVRDGDPGWPAYTSEQRTTGVLTDTLTTVDDPDGDERRLWDGVR
ncbi:carboxylesterase/lipase family protein [Nocardioides mangrovicus]|uniref:Carboxylic ester hydrolase n=1 Tax=Nocardioides mangrovicus TaxID=2478913 RepID=A0A3L8P2F5_9ACTN|nr:carboxylesterase family protein [Nocardioides mangrovicus]RLV48608.1 carboxylesterase/lipase family protein [Nocardioides mangrovicus]